jgi:hypothetical protein
MNRKFGKESFSYLLNRLPIPTVVVNLYSDKPIPQQRWGECFRRDFKALFCESYENYLSTQKVVVLGKELNESTSS